MQTAHARVLLQQEASAVVLPRGEVLVGRSLQCFLHIDDPRVSRVHVRIFVGGTITIEDAGSSNGTLVNDAILRGVTELDDGDRISLGGRVLVLRIADDGPGERGSELETAPDAIRRLAVRSVGGADAGPSRRGAELEQRCSGCGALLPSAAPSCPDCGLQLRGGRSDRATEPENLTIPVARRDSRQKVSLVARYTSENVSLRASALNLSRRGVFVMAKKIEPVGTRCWVKLIPSEGEPATLHGFVRHAIHRGPVPGMGIEFDALDLDSVRWLARQLLRTRRSKD